MVTSMRSLNYILSFGAKKLFEEGEETDDADAHWEYNDTAINDLLDREKHVAQEQEQKETPSQTAATGGGLLNDFRIAPAAQVTARQANVSENNGEDFWDELLRDRVEKNKKIEPEMGRGMRVRRPVNYSGDTPMNKRKANVEAEGHRGKRRRTDESSSLALSESSVVISDQEDVSSDLSVRCSV